MSVDQKARELIDDLNKAVWDWTAYANKIFMEYEERIAALEADNADLRRRIGLPARKETNADH